MREHDLAGHLKTMPDDELHTPRRDVERVPTTIMEPPALKTPA